MALPVDKREPLTLVEFDRLMRDSWRGELERLSDVLERLAAWPFERTPWHPSTDTQLPALDMFKEDGRIVVKVGLPGARPEELEATIEGDVLTIRRQYKQEQTDEKERSYYYREQRAASFVRQVQLPEEVDSDKAEAELRHGVLTIRLVPVMPAVSAKKIQLSR